MNKAKNLNKWLHSLILILTMASILSLEVSNFNYSNYVPFPEFIFYYDDYLIFQELDLVYQTPIYNKSAGFSLNKCSYREQPVSNGYLNSRGDFYLVGTNLLQFSVWIAYLNPLSCEISNVTTFPFSSSNREVEITFDEDFVIFTGLYTIVVDTVSNEIVCQTDEAIFDIHRFAAGILTFYIYPEYYLYNCSSKTDITYDQNYTIIGLIELKLQSETFPALFMETLEGNITINSIKDNKVAIEYTLDNPGDFTYCPYKDIKLVSPNQFQIIWHCGSRYFFCIYSVQSSSPFSLTSNCPDFNLIQDIYSILGSDLLYISNVYSREYDYTSFAYVQNRTDLKIPVYYSGLPECDLGNGLTLTRMLYRNDWSGQEWQAMPQSNGSIYVYGDYVFISDFYSSASIISPDSELLTVPSYPFYQYKYVTFAYNAKFEGEFYFAFLLRNNTILINNIQGDAILSIVKLDTSRYELILGEKGVYLFYSNTTYVGFSWQGDILVNGELSSCSENSLTLANSSCISCLDAEDGSILLYDGATQELIWSNAIPHDPLVLASANENFSPIQIDPQTGQINYYSIVNSLQDQSDEFLIYGVDGQSFTIENYQSIITYPDYKFIIIPKTTQINGPATYLTVYELISGGSPYVEPSPQVPLGLLSFGVTLLLTICLYFQDKILNCCTKKSNKEKILDSVDLSDENPNRTNVQELVWIHFLSEKNWARFKIAFVAGTGFLFSVSLMGLRLISFYDHYFSLIRTFRAYPGVDDLSSFLFIFFPITSVLSFLSLTLKSKKWREILPFNLCIHMIITVRIAVPIGKILFINPRDLFFNGEYTYPYLSLWIPNLVVYIAGVTILSIVTIASPLLSLSQLKNTELIINEMKIRIEKVKSNQIPPLDVDDKIIQYCDLVGRSNFFSFRDITIFTSIVPGIVNLFLSKGTLQLNQCAAYDYTYHLLPQEDCQLTLDKLNVSYSVSIWNSSWISFAILVVIALFLFTMIRSILVLHKYRAKFFAARVKFTDQLTMLDIIKDIAWNALITYILIYMILDQVNEAIPSSLEAAWIDGNGIGFTGASMGNPLNYTNATNFAYTNLYASFQSDVSIYGPFSFIALLGSLYGLMFHSKSSVLLSFFRERDLLILTSVSDLKIRYEIPNDSNHTLEFIRSVDKWFPNESPRTKLTALMSYFEDIGMMKEVKISMESWNPEAYFHFKQS